MLDLENKRRLGFGLVQYKNYDEFTGDKDDQDESISLKSDFILNEATNIARDYVDLDFNLLAIKQNKNYENYKEIPSEQSIVAKIKDGIGAEKLYIFKNRADLKNNERKLSDDHVFQKYFFL